MASRHVAAATARVRMAGLSDALAALEPSLAWAPRATGGPSASPDWPDGHLNAMIVGPNGQGCELGLTAVYVLIED